MRRPLLLISFPPMAFLISFPAIGLLTCLGALLLVPGSADAAADPFRKACRKQMGWSNAYAKTVTERSSPSLYMAFQDCLSKKMAASTKH